MSEQQQSYTPGPWFVGVGGNAHANRVWTKDMLPIVNLCSMSSIVTEFDPEAQANGRLIAAAPTMAEALKDAQQALWQYANDLRFPPVGDSVERRLAAAEAACQTVTAALESAQVAA